MARGDVVSGIASVAADASLVYQPPLGTEVMIYEVGSSTWGGASPNATPEVFIELTDGAIKSRFRWGRQVTHWSGGTLKLFITNTLYLSIVNGATVSANLAYSGIQIK